MLSYLRSSLERKFFTSLVRCTQPKPLVLIICPIFSTKNTEPIVGGSEVEAVLNTLNSGQILQSLNHTFITLIPKKRSPTFVSNFRPISLCNVLYKLIFKVIVNKLMLILPEIFSYTQSAFFLSRQITNNVLVAYKLIYLLKRKTKGKKEYMSLKLDMSKTYDRAEWSYLEKVMETLGFTPHLTSFILTCISTVTFSILINGKPTCHITPSQGLTQGDPLSLYFFSPLY